MTHLNDIPRGYSMTGKLNLRADRSEYRRWNLFSAVLSLCMLALGWRLWSFDGIRQLFAAGFTVYGLHLAALFAAVPVYAQLYQLTRAAALRLLGRQSPCWRRQGLLQIPGSYVYFSRARFAAVTLLPLLFWLAALTVLCAAVPESWRWNAYLLLIYHIGGNLAAAHAVFHALRAPKTALLRTTGVQTLIFTEDPQ